MKKGVFKNFAKFTGKHMCQGLLFNKIAAIGFAKSCEFCVIFKNTFFTEHLPATASECFNSFKCSLSKYSKGVV